jgi:predicted Zn-dependent protease
MNQDYRFDLAQQYLFSGQTDLAIDQLKGLLAEDPDNAIFHGFLAECLLDSMRLYSAEYELKLAFQLDPLIPYLHYVHARILYLQNKPEEAIEACAEVLSLDPEFAEALRFKAQILLSRNDKKAALENLERAASIEPDSPDTFSSLGSYYLEIGKLERAYQFAEQALNADAGDEDANLLMAEVALRQGRNEDAEYHLMFVIRNNPSSQQALTLFANLKLRKNIFLGMWWRFNASVSKFSPLQLSLVLVAGFLLFNLLSLILHDLGLSLASDIVRYGWLALVAYSWVGIPAYYKAIEKEIASFRFCRDY